MLWLLLGLAWAGPEIRDASTTTVGVSGAYSASAAKADLDVWLGQRLHWGIGRIGPSDMTLLVDGRLRFDAIGGPAVERAQVRALGVRLDSDRLTLDLGRTPVFGGGPRLVDGVQLRWHPTPAWDVGLWAGLAPDLFTTRPVVRPGAGPVLGWRTGSVQWSLVGEVLFFDGGLEQSRLVNDHRGMLGYSGTYQGQPVSVQTTGMGTPSTSIIVEELLNLGAKRFVRVGTTGGIGRGVRSADLIVGTSATPADGATSTYLPGDPYAPVADFELTRALVDAARAQGASTHVGPILTVDVFYNPDPDYVPKWRARGILGVEMEAAALFTLVSRAQAAGDDVRAACILTVSDTMSEEEEIGDTYLPLDALEKATDVMIRVALEAGLSL